MIAAIALDRIANTTSPPIRVQSSTADPRVIPAAGAMSSNFFDVVANVFLKGLIKPGLRFGNDGETGHDRYADGNSEGNTH